MHGMKYICGTATCVTWPLQVSNHYVAHHSTNHCSAASRTVLQHTLCSALKCSSTARPDTVGEAVRSWAKTEQKLQTLQKLLLLSWSGSFCSIRRLYLSFRSSCANSVFIIGDNLIDHGRALTGPAHPSSCSSSHSACSCECPKCKKFHSISIQICVSCHCWLMEKHLHSPCLFIHLFMKHLFSL